MAKELIKGNVAFAEAAVRAGVEAYFGYPITPQTEALEWMSHRMPELGRTFVQAESELGAINMVYGAACAGRRTMTSSSSPGASLMMEGISYIAATEVPAVIVDVMRGGPGLGNIAPAQADYNQIVHGGGHGDYYPIVLAPASVQELIDLTSISFDLAETYRSVVIVLIDGCLGQMMEPAELPPMRPLEHRSPEWATDGAVGREKRIHTSIYLDPRDMEVTNLRLLRRWREVEANEVRYKGYYLEDAHYVVVGFGTAGRIALSAVRMARQMGLPVGLLRPVTLNPFPIRILEDLAGRVEGMLVVEMNNGQMVDDVLRAVGARTAVEFYGQPGGVMPLPDDILPAIDRLVNGSPTLKGHPRDRWFQTVVHRN